MTAPDARPNDAPASPTPAKTDHAAKAAERRAAGLSIREHHLAIASALNVLGHDSRAARLAELSRILGRPVGAFAELTDPDAVTVMNHLIRALEAPRDDA